jgi:hypothetical protein
MQFYSPVRYGWPYFMKSLCTNYLLYTYTYIHTQGCIQWVLLPAAARCKACVYRSSLSRIAGSNPYSRVKKSKTSQPLKMGPIGCPETAVQNYHPLHNIPTYCRSHLHPGGSLKSRKLKLIMHLSFYSACPHYVPSKSLQSITIWNVRTHGCTYAIYHMDLIRVLNPLKTKRMFYTWTQCVPRCKHSPPRL